MSPNSIGILRRIRDRIAASLTTYPNFEAGFAFGVQTGFKGPDSDPREIPYDPGDPCGFNITWSMIGHRVGLPRLIHKEVGSAFMRFDPPEDRPIDSKLIYGVFASDGEEVAGRKFLKDISCLDSWIHDNWRWIPGFGPHISLQCSWIGLVCLLKIHETSHFTFSLSWITEPDRRTGRYARPFRTTDAFWEVICLESDEPPAVFLMLPNHDAREVSIEVIDHLITIAERGVRNHPSGLESSSDGGRDPRAGSSVIVKDPDTEERDKFIYEQCCNGQTYKLIKSEMNKNQSWGSIRSPQGIKDAAKRYAARHGLPVPGPRTAGRKPKK